MCGWLEIISLTPQGVLLPSQTWLLGNSILQSLPPGGNQVTPTYYHHVGVLLCLNCKTVSFFLSVANVYQLVWPGSGVPPRLAVAERLHQFIQQSPYVVVLLRGASYGFVAHGADAANLQPLHQTPAQKITDRRNKKRSQAEAFFTKFTT